MAIVSYLRLVLLREVINKSIFIIHGMDNDAKSKYMRGVLWIQNSNFWLWKTEKQLDKKKQQVDGLTPDLSFVLIVNPLL